ncbi:hypothetical protein, partial [Streptococcus pneumoniae]
GLFFYTKIGSIISIGDLPTTNIIEPFKCCGFGSILSKNREILDTVKALNAGFYCLQPYIFS